MKFAVLLAGLVPRGRPTEGLVLRLHPTQDLLAPLLPPLVYHCPVPVEDPYFHLHSCYPMYGGVSSGSQDSVSRSLGRILAGALVSPYGGRMLIQVWRDVRVTDRAGKGAARA